MAKSLQGKIALVTGASRGIGKAIAVKPASEGATVAVHFGTQASRADEVVSTIEASGGRAFALQADLTDVGSIAAMFDAFDKKLAEFGTSKFDILVNNAGINAEGSIETLSEADYDRLFATNVKGLFFTSQHGVSRLNDGGRLINLSSMVGHNAYPAAVAYAATKAAVDSMTLSMAAGLGPRGITVNAVAPGATETDFIGKYMQDDRLARIADDRGRSRLSR
jgi:NAD(P)-dependent dehydrogenase (short-subunit alcohol dehydrogenase family)